MTEDRTDTAQAPATGERPITSTRDRDDLRDRLQAWLRAKHHAGTAATIGEFDPPTGNGMSSETILFDRRYRTGRAWQRERLVVRLTPDADAVPVFPTYDLEKQFRVMQLVGERSNVAGATDAMVRADDAVARHAVLGDGPHRRVMYHPT